MTIKFEHDRSKYFRHDVFLVWLPALAGHFSRRAPQTNPSHVLFVVDSSEAFHDLSARLGHWLQHSSVTSFPDIQPQYLLKQQQQHIQSSSRSILSPQEMGEQANLRDTCPISKEVHEGLLASVTAPDQAETVLPWGPSAAANSIVGTGITPETKSYQSHPTTEPRNAADESSPTPLIAVVRDAQLAFFHINVPSLEIPHPA